MLPPETGSKKENQYWWTIDPQQLGRSQGWGIVFKVGRVARSVCFVLRPRLVNELWSAIYPGMVKKAAELQRPAKIVGQSEPTKPLLIWR